MLRYRDIEQHIPDRGTVYVYHCKRGEGNNKLGITRFRDGTVKAHCFHCGDKGTWKPDVRPLDSLKNLHKAVKREFHLPYDFEMNVSKWPGWAYAWPTQYGVTEDELNFWGVGYSARYDCVVLPCYSSSGFVGYQTRNRNPTRKYDSFRVADYLYNICVRYPGAPVVLVEDIISSIKVGRQFNVCAMLSTSANDGVLAEMSKYNYFVIWLDNNNYKVKEKRAKLKRTLSLLGNVKVVEDLSDPKKYTNEQIRGAVCGQKL